MYRQMITFWPDPDRLVKGGELPVSLFDDPEARRWQGCFEERMMFADALTYLPDDILTKVDRAAMAVSLETRVPLLDHRLIEYVWGLPTSLRIQNEDQKWLLKQVLYKHIPRQLVDRPKMGFGVPLGEWLRGPLRDWAEDLLDPARMEQEGYFVVPTIRRRWGQHLSGRYDWRDSLWAILMFQAFVRRLPERTTR
jgi:asparagine synthase (glutamine-hydrolysing)